MTALRDYRRRERRITIFFVAGAVLMWLAYVAAFAAVGYVAVHFIGKYW
jgi:hypothetical protein